MEGPRKQFLNDIQTKTEEISMLRSKLQKKQEDVLQMDGEVERYKIQIKSLNDQISEMKCQNIELKARKDEEMLGSETETVKS